MARDLENLLGGDEKIVLQTRQHWFVLLRTTWLHLLGFAVLLLLAWLTTQPDWLDNTGGAWVGRALVALAAVLVLVAAWRILQWVFERFYLTTSKVVYASGVLNRNVVSTPFVKIDEVTLVRPLLGRMLGFGRLEVENASGGREPLAGLEYLPKPAALYQAVTERARHQRMLEGGGRDDRDGDGYVDEASEAASAASPTERGDGERWTPPGSSTR